MAYCTRKNMCTDKNSSTSLEKDKSSSVRPAPKRNKLSATSRLSEMMLDQGIHLHDTKSKDNVVSSVESCDNSSQIKDIERSPGNIMNPIKYDPSNPRSTKNMSFLKSIDAGSTDTSSISSAKNTPRRRTRQTLSVQERLHALSDAEMKDNPSM